MSNKAESKRLLLIINPRSGKREAEKNLQAIVDKFSEAGYETEVMMTKARGDARKFAIAYGERSDVVVASGGDGTFNEVIDGLITSGADVDIGYIPSGSTNDFANSLGLPKGIFNCVDRIIDGRAVPIDVGCFNGRYFSYVASFGIFTATTYTVPQNLKNILGHAAYVLGGIKEIANLKPIHAKITMDKGTTDERVCEGDYVLGGICNSKSVGGILNLRSLDVDLNDGVMEVLLVKMPKNIIELNAITISMLSGSFKADQIETYSAKESIVEIDPDVPWTLDGEYGGSAEVCEIKTIPSAIRVIR